MRCVNGVYRLSIKVRIADLSDGDRSLKGNEEAGRLGCVRRSSWGRLRVWIGAAIPVLSDAQWSLIESMLPNPTGWTWHHRLATNGTWDTIAQTLVAQADAEGVVD